MNKNWDKIDNKISLSNLIYIIIHKADLKEIILTNKTQNSDILNTNCDGL